MSLLKECLESLSKTVFLSDVTYNIFFLIASERGKTKP